MVPRIRTVREVANFFKSEDPASYVGEAWIRKQIREGVFPTIRSGNRMLLNLDEVLKILSDPELMKPKLTIVTPSRPSRMRKID